MYSNPAHSTALSSSNVEQRLALALDAARLGTWTWDMASGVTIWDARLEELHGLAPGGFGGTFDDWLAALYPDDRDQCVARVEAALARPGPYSLLHRTIWGDGSVHWIECRGTVLVDADYVPVGTTGVAMDVTSRQRRQAATGETLAEQRYLIQILQQALLPVALPQVPRTRVAARYHAAETNAVVGGDWYAVLPLDGDRLGLAIGDVAGHGLDAVADMAAARFSLRALALTELQPDVVLDRLNHVVSVFDADTMITALYGVLDPNELTWRYASAGHLPVVLRGPDGSARFLDAQCGTPLGLPCAFVTREVPIERGSTLLLYTDGLIERRSETITAGLERLLCACREAPSEIEEFCDVVLDVMLRDIESEDDIALVAVVVE